MKVLLLSSFSGVSPFSLQQHPEQFDALVKRVLDAQERHPPLNSWNRSSVVEVDENFVPPYHTLAVRAAEDGTAVVWKMRSY